MHAPESRSILNYRLTLCFVNQHNRDTVPDRILLAALLADYLIVFEFHVAFASGTG